MTALDVQDFFFALGQFLGFLTVMFVLAILLGGSFHE